MSLKCVCVCTTPSLSLSFSTFHEAINGNALMISLKRQKHCHCLPSGGQKRTEHPFQELYCELCKKISRTCVWGGGGRNVFQSGNFQIDLVVDWASIFKKKYLYFVRGLICTSVEASLFFSPSAPPPKKRKPSWKLEEFYRERNNPRRLVGR